MAANEEISRRLGELDGLYERDPERFELLARDLIERAIADYPPEHQQRARGLQFVVDSRLARHGNALARMTVVMEMMWESVESLAAILNDPQAVLEERQRCSQKSRVIPLVSSRERH